MLRFEKLHSESAIESETAQTYLKENPYSTIMDLEEENFNTVLYRVRIGQMEDLWAYLELDSRHEDKVESPKVKAFVARLQSPLPFYARLVIVSCGFLITRAATSPSVVHNTKVDQTGIYDENSAKFSAFFQ